MEKQQKKEERMNCFCFGSNGLAQLEQRLNAHGQLSPLPAIVLDHLRVYAGYGQRWGGGVSSIMPFEGGLVFGSVVALTPQQFRDLDGFEGIPHGMDPYGTDGVYRRQEVTFITSLPPLFSFSSSSPPPSSSSSSSSSSSFSFSTSSPSSFYPSLASVKRQKAIAYIMNDPEWFGPPSLSYLNACFRNISQFWPNHWGKESICWHGEREGEKEGKKKERKEKEGKKKERKEKEGKKKEGEEKEGKKKEGEQTFILPVLKPDFSIFQYWSPEEHITGLFYYPPFSCPFSSSSSSSLGIPATTKNISNQKCQDCGLRALRKEEESDQNEEISGFFYDFGEEREKMCRTVDKSSPDGAIRSVVEIEIYGEKEKEEKEEEEKREEKERKKRRVLVWIVHSPSLDCCQPKSEKNKELPRHLY